MLTVNGATYPIHGRVQLYLVGEAAEYGCVSTTTGAQAVALQRNSCKGAATASIFSFFLVFGAEAKKYRVQLLSAGPVIALAQ
jgi:hypothetical protein